jgi:hypothetical protein
MSVLTCNVLECARTSLQKLICTVSASLNSGRREYNIPSLLFFLATRSHNMMQCEGFIFF